MESVNLGVKSKKKKKKKIKGKKIIRDTDEIHLYKLCLKNQSFL